MPTLLHPTPTGLTDEDLNNYEWKMDQVNPDPIVNKLNKSIISIFEHNDDEIGYWCKRSFTISNRISKFYEGQDGQNYIFARESPVADSESKRDETCQKATNNILLHIFEQYSHEILTIQENSHFARELLRKQQVKKGE